MIDAVTRTWPVLQIQRLRPDDVERFREIRLRSLRDAPTMFGSTFEDLVTHPPESWRQQLEQLATFVAVADHSDIGVVRGGAYTPRPNAAILYSMWVEPAFRGRGVGEALIDTVVDWARSEGFASLVLDVTHHNEHAIALYARKGFVRIDDEDAPDLDRDNEHRRELRL